MAENDGLILPQKFAIFYVLRDKVEELTDEQIKTLHPTYINYLHLRNELYPLVLTGEEIIEYWLGDLRKEHEQIGKLNKRLTQIQNELSGRQGTVVDRLKSILSSE